jgi:hypothetical protein
MLPDRSSNISNAEIKGDIFRILFTGSNITTLSILLLSLYKPASDPMTAVGGIWQPEHKKKQRQVSDLPLPQSLGDRVIRYYSMGGITST